MMTRYKHPLLGAEFKHIPKEQREQLPLCCLRRCKGWLEATRLDFAWLKVEEQPAADEGSSSNSNSRSACWTWAPPSITPSTTQPAASMACGRAKLVRAGAPRSVKQRQRWLKQHYNQRQTLMLPSHTTFYLPNLPYSLPCNHPLS